VEKKSALNLWDALIATGMPHGLMPAGMLALDVARLEAGLMLIDVDYVPARKALIEGQTSSPFELDLGWTVNLKKERFVGRDALAAEAARDPLGASPASRSTGIRSSASTPRSGWRRACRRRPGA
jgi:aminomethyltransferase